MRLAAAGVERAARPVPGGGGGAAGGGVVSACQRATILGRIRRCAQKISVSRGTIPRPPRHLRRVIGARGFTLLEVLVALAILSLAIVVSIQAFAAGLRLLKVSGEHQEAMLIADQKAREVTAPTTGGTDSGTEGAYSWERDVKIVATPDLDIEGRTVKWRMWEVDVRVKWGERRQVSVATLRTVSGDGDVPTPRP